MSKIRSKNTSFENHFFKLLRKHGIVFKTHPPKLIGHPDLVIKDKKICVFLDSDFWHGWQYPRWRHKMKNGFWRQKIENNRKRDKKTTRRLRRMGWKVLRIWEHEIKSDISASIKKLIRLNNIKPLVGC